MVDLGYGASPVTTIELADRLVRVRPDVEVVGLEIDPERVRAAQPLARDGVRFAHGGFELGPVGARRPVLVRAANVLRQYGEHEVPAAWDEVVRRLAPDGLLVDATCDELGRRAAWVAVGPEGPLSLTVSLRLRALDRPGAVAERLPKALIHRNVPGEPVHAWLGRAGRRLGAQRGAGVLRCAATVPGHVPRRAGGGLAGARRPGAVAARRGGRRLGRGRAPLTAGTTSLRWRARSR